MPSMTHDPRPVRPVAPLYGNSTQMTAYWLELREYEHSQRVREGTLIRRVLEAQAQAEEAERQRRTDARLAKQVAALAAHTPPPSTSKKRRRHTCQHPEEARRQETPTRVRCLRCDRCWRVEAPEQPLAADSLTPGCQACREDWPAWEHIAGCSLYKRRPEPPTLAQRVAAWWRGLWS